MACSKACETGMLRMACASSSRSWEMSCGFIGQKYGIFRTFARDAE